MTKLAIAALLLVGACTTSQGGPSYTEANDTTNNWNVGGTPEATGLTLGATGSIFIDAEVNSGHYDTEDLDNDTFTFAVSAASTATVTLTGDSADMALTFFDVTMLGVVNGVDDTGVGSDVMVGQPTVAPLVPGTYKLEMHAQNPQPITTSFPYTIEVTAGG